jgi:DNA-binding response OmpR family regulator
MGNVKKKILIVEDDLALQSVLFDRLKSEALYDVFKASDGEEAIGLIVEKRPELILLDLLLPKLDGFKVLERVRRHPDKEVSESKVIVLSNLWSNKDILRAQALKIEDYYVKANTNLEDVVIKVNVLLKGS